MDVGGGIGSTSMLLARAFGDGGLRFVVQDRPVVVEMGEKVCGGFFCGVTDWRRGYLWFFKPFAVPVSLYSTLDFSSAVPSRRLCNC